MEVKTDLDREIIGLISEETFRGINAPNSRLIEVPGVGQAVLFFGDGKSKVSVGSELIDQHYLDNPDVNPTEFDYYIVFGKEFQKRVNATRDYVPLEDYWIDAEQIKFPEIRESLRIAQDTPMLRRALFDVMLNANTPGVYGNEELQEEYSKALSDLANLVAGDTIIFEDFDFVLQIVRAGEFIGQEIREQISPTATIYNINEKRVKLNSGQLTVGLNDTEGILQSSTLDGARILTTEACVASAVSLAALEIVISAMRTDENRQLPAQHTIFAPIASQRGLELLFRTSRGLTSNLNAVTSPDLVRRLNQSWYLVGHLDDLTARRMAYLLNDKYNLSLTPGDIQSLGDGGDLTNGSRIRNNQE
jgi:hypothetical protein